MKYTQLLNWINQSELEVFVRDDFPQNLTSEMELALIEITRLGVLINIYPDLYIRAKLSRFKQNPIPINGLSTLYTAAEKLGYAIDKSRNYAKENLTQVPTGRVIYVDQPTDVSFRLNDMVIRLVYSPA